MQPVNRTEAEPSTNSAPPIGRKRTNRNKKELEEIIPILYVLPLIV